MIEVIAEPEKLPHIESVARVAYRLSSRHVPVQVSERFLRVAAEESIEALLKEMGASVSSVEAPFEPEADGRAGHHAHDHCDDHEHHHHDHGHGHEH